MPLGAHKIAKTSEMTENRTDMALHALPAREVFQALSTETTGLSANEAAHRLVTHGPNKLPEPRRRGPILRFLSQF